MEKLTPEMLMTFLVVAAILVGFVLTVWGLIDRIKKAREPHDALTMWRRETDEKLQNDKKRIDSLERGQGVMLRGINAMISHELNGNSSDKLKQSQQEIMDYLIDR